MIVLINSVGIIQRIVQSVEFEDLTGLTALEREIPIGYPENYQWNTSTLEFEEIIPVPSIDMVDAIQLLTENELAAIFSSGSGPVIGLVLGLIVTTLRKTKVPIESTYHQQGALLLHQAGFLTTERYQEFLIGQPPSIGI